MKTCNHFRNQIPSEISDELRVMDIDPCEVCDTKDRCIFNGTLYRNIPKFNGSYTINQYEFPAPKNNNNHYCRPNG